jgi:outer membrane protein assembly factor BamB
MRKRRLEKTTDPGIVDPGKTGQTRRWLCFVMVCATAASASAENWPAWRGPRGDGTCAEKGLPTVWSKTDNVAWKAPLPEPGNSTPIVSGKHVFVTQAIDKEGLRTLMCFDRKDGRLLWQKGTTWKEKELTHEANPFCPASPVTDGERVIAWFGSAGVFCYDFEGNDLWKRDLGIQKHIWGYGASPVIHGELCYLNFGPGERSFLIAMDKRTGETVWQHDEPINRLGTPEAEFSSLDYYGSWSTPLLCNVNGRTELVISLPFRVVSFEPATGKEIWSSTGTNALVYTSPLYAEGTIVAMGGFNGMTIALAAGGSGDVTNTNRLWRHPKTKQRIGSGVIHNGHIYIHNDPGIAECFELATGNRVWEERLQGESSRGTNWSSVMLADGLCYTINQGGDCFVFKASPQFELVSVNSLGELSNSSIVPSDGQLFIRTHQHLWCIGQRQ